MFQASCWRAEMHTKAWYKEYQEDFCYKIPVWKEVYEGFLKNEKQLFSF